MNELETNVDNLSEFLPDLISLKNRPMSLVDHFPFFPLFDTQRPPMMVWAAGRQLGKSRSCAADLILRAAFEPGHESLVVLPLQDQSDRMSNVIFKPMTVDSPISSILAPDGEIGNVRMHAYANGSITHFSYASNDAERIRSYSCSLLMIDESQDVDQNFVPIIAACLDGQEDPGIVVTGSSKTKDTFLYNSYQSSSQGVWHIKCPACGFENKCCVEPDGHLLSIIGPARDDISEKRPGTLCHKCRTPINSRYGEWVHRFPERLRDCAGYQVPQVIMPGHATKPDKWRKLVSKMNGGLGFTTGRFYNEILGEPYDMAYKMITVDDLRKAATGVGPNTEAHAAFKCRKYTSVVLGVDWGGGGEEGVSRTKVAVCGLRGDGRIEVFHGMQFPPAEDPVSEAVEVVRLMRSVNGIGVAHDFNGAGTVSESVMSNNGVDVRQLIPIRYGSYPGMKMLSVTPPTGHRMRQFYQMDKGRSIQFLCSAIKAGYIKFFDYDYKDVHQPGLIHDFLSLVSANIDTPSGSVFRVRKQSKSMTDDFAHAVNFACAALFEMHHCWPHLATAGVIV